MSQLVGGIYGTEFHPANGPFSLHCGQMKSGRRKLTHNSGWYNKYGEKLGWGDLDVDDFIRIHDGLEAGEVFVILSQGDSHFNIVFRHVPVSEGTPGTDYVVKYCMYVITKDAYYLPNDNFPGQEKIEIAGITLQLVSREVLRSLMV